jgi:hypothetical protein
MPMTHLKCKYQWVDGAVDPHKDCKACPFESGECLPWELTLAISNQMISGREPDRKRIGVTSVVRGSCIRQAALKKMFDYGDTPQDLLPAFSGNAIHKELERQIGGPEGDVGVEAKMEIDLGDGYRLCGVADLVNEQGVVDWKCGALNKRLKLGYQQQVLTYGAYFHSKGVCGTSHRVVFTAKPGYQHHMDGSGGEQEEALSSTLGRAGLVMAVLKGDEEVKSLSAEGRDIYFGSKSSCSWCSVRDECDAVDGEHSAAKGDI